MKKQSFTHIGLMFILSLFLFSGQLFAQQSFSSTLPSQAITDDGYDGTIASMTTMPIEVNTGFLNLDDITVELNVTHTYVGDLVIKLEAPDGTIIGLMSRPGFTEPADDGSACCGNPANLVSSTPVTFMDGAPDSAENMGSNLIPVVGDDGVVTFAPAPGSIGGFPDFASFAAVVTDINGTWLLHIGDSGGLDQGNINSVTLNITASVPIVVPTMSQWGLFLFALLSMSLGIVFMYKMENQHTLSSSAGDISGSFQSNLPFELDLFKTAMKHALGLAVVGFAIILVGWGTIVPMDIIGMSIAIPLVAYMIHITKMMEK